MLLSAEEPGQELGLLGEELARFVLSVRRQSAAPGTLLAWM